MYCEKCGEELTPGKHFCTHCGAAVPEGGQASDAPSTSTPTVAPAPVYVPPPVPGKTPGKLSGKSTGWKVLAVVLCLVVLAGIAVGIVFIVKAALGNPPVAKISLLTLKRKDGKSLDLKKVPLDVDVTMTAVFEARYPAGGKGTLRMYVESQDGEELTGETYKVSSKSGSQKKEYILNMSSGSGKPLKAVAKLEVSPPKGKKVSDRRSVTYRAMTGTVEDNSTDTKADVETARKNVENDFNDLMTTAQTANAAGVDISDVKNEIADLGVQITEAETVEELDKIDARISQLQKQLQARMIR
jgi:hypothetical protein